VMMRRALLDRVGLFDEQLRASEDADLAWRCGTISEYAVLPEVLTIHTRDWVRDVRIYRQRQREKIRVRLRWYRNTGRAPWTYLLVAPDVAAYLLPASVSAYFRSRHSRRPHRDLAPEGRATVDEASTPGSTAAP
jgi:GT2 family glycosyltransferase